MEFINQGVCKLPDSVIGHRTIGILRNDPHLPFLFTHYVVIDIEIYPAQL